MTSDTHATVRSFDAETGSGDVLLDDGRVVAFGGDAFARSGLRLLRPGQRVRLGYDDAGSVRSVVIATFPDPA
jgi:2-phospho-L-lactate guanylyltransferase